MLKLPFIILRVGIISIIPFLWLHFATLYHYQSSSTFLVKNNFTLGFLSPATSKFYNSLYSENYTQQKQTLEFTDKQKSFIQKSLLFATAKSQTQNFKSCVLKNTQSYPITDFPRAVVMNLYDFNPYKDLESINKQKQLLYFSLLKEELPDQIVAYAATNAFSVTNKSNDISIPGMIYLNRSTLNKAINNNDVSAYGAQLLHETLHLYGHAHPGKDLDTQYDTAYFINTVTDCIQ